MTTLTYITCNLLLKRVKPKFYNANLCIALHENVNTSDHESEIKFIYTCPPRWQAQASGVAGGNTWVAWGGEPPGTGPLPLWMGMIGCGCCTAVGACGAVTGTGVGCTTWVAPGATDSAWGELGVSWLGTVTLTGAAAGAAVAPGASWACCWAHSCCSAAARWCACCRARNSAAFSCSRWNCCLSAINCWRWYSRPSRSRSMVVSNSSKWRSCKFILNSIIDWFQIFIKIWTFLF